LLKDIPPGELVQAVRDAYQGKVQLHPDVARKLMSAIAAKEPAPPPAAVEPDLTERELKYCGCWRRAEQPRDRTAVGHQ